MQCSLQPKTACSRLSPPRASQPAPGLRFPNQADGAHDLARRAETALQAVVRDERLLHRMQPSAPRHAFDREDICAVVADGECKARIHAPSVDNGGTGAALAAVTALLGSRQAREEGRAESRVDHRARLFWARR
jgi:hypothetical protein